MWHQEEIECAMNYLSLLDKAVINVGSLGRIDDAGRSAHFEESLSYSLVNNYEGVLR